MSDDPTASRSRPERVQPRAREEPVGGYTRTISRDPSVWRKAYTPADTEARIVELFEDDEQPYGISQIAATLTAEGRSSATGRTSWTYTMVRNALVQAGKLQPRAAEDDDGRKGRQPQMPAELIGRMLRMRETGMSNQEIADTLNGEGVPMPRGEQWTKGAVRYHLLGRSLSSSESDAGG